MIEVVPAYHPHISSIIELSQKVWPTTFASILSKKQIAYMMKMMYSRKSLINQINSGHQFAIAHINNNKVGFVSFETNYQTSNSTKIHKLYILPQHQRVGVGKTLIKYVIDKATEASNSSLILNVNKNNAQAIDFYIKNSFKRIREEVIDIGENYVMDDYVFERFINLAPNH